METAGSFRRLVADYLDMFFIGIVGAIPSVLFFGDNYAEASQIIGLFLQVLYFSILESSKWQRTLGQKCLRLYVCSLQHERLSFGRAFLREILKISLLLGVAIVFGILCFPVFMLCNFYQNFTLRIVLVLIWVIGLLVSAFSVLYVRFCKDGQQTIRDYASKSFMVLLPKTDK